MRRTGRKQITAYWHKLIVHLMEGFFFFLISFMDANIQYYSGKQTRLCLCALVSICPHYECLTCQHMEDNIKRMAAQQIRKQDKKKAIPSFSLAFSALILLFPGKTINLNLHRAFVWAPRIGGLPRTVIPLFKHKIEGGYEFSDATTNQLAPGACRHCQKRNYFLSLQQTSA